MPKIYIEARGGLLVGEAAATTARLLIGLGAVDASLSSDETGTHFVVSEDVMSAFLDQIDSKDIDGEPAPKRRRRAAKPKAEPEASEADSESNAEDSDTQE